MNTIWSDVLGAEVRYRGKQFKTRTIEAGSGEPLIFLHGIGGHAEAFSRNFARLGKHFRVIAIDLVWHGFSSTPAVPNAMNPIFVEQYLDLLDDFGLERASVEGESLGGWIALELAIKHPDRLSKMVLNTAYGFKLRGDAAEEDTESGLNQLRERSIAAISNPTRDVVRKRLEWLMASPARVTDELVEIRHAIYSRPETQTALKSVYSVAFSGNRQDELFGEDRLSTIRTPTLVLWTDKNPGMGPEAGKALARVIPGSDFSCIADAAHWPQWEKPEEHDRVVLGFLKK